MGVSKVTYAAKVLIDLTSDTVSAANLKAGATAHDAAGNAVTGSMDGMMFLSGDTLACPDGLASVGDGVLALSGGHASVSADGVLSIVP